MDGIWKILSLPKEWQLTTMMIMIYAKDVKENGEKKRQQKKSVEFVSVRLCFYTSKYESIVHIGKNNNKDGINI